MTKILIAEEDDGVADFLKDLFEKIGPFQILRVLTPEESILLVETEKPDWFFLALEFGSSRPVGLEVLEKVRMISPQTKTIAMTTNQDLLMKQKALELGAADCLIKPSDFKIPRLKEYFETN